MRNINANTSGSLTNKLHTQTKERAGKKLQLNYKMDERKKEKKNNYKKKINDEFLKKKWTVHCQRRFGLRQRIVPQTARTSRAASSSHCNGSKPLSGKLNARKHILDATHKAEMQQNLPKTENF